MTYRDWLPSVWIGHKDDEQNSYLSLRKQINTLFDDFGNGSFSEHQAFTVHSNVSETEDAFCVTADLPGIETKDVEVTVTGNRITIQGEKTSEKEEKKEEKGRQFHRIERSSGSFHRMMIMPFEIDPDTVKADVKDGVLTVTIPKPAEMIEKTKKIEVKSSD
ncbi:MAG: Hsp20/alpha crystallin family protein [Thermodesulfovibrionia bacterium]|nr:Hsp20/alpha crystallin family protein [Thermodesulfovibrionia bacterium]